MTEQELTILARKGDQEAFAQLVRDNERRVYTLALRMCGSPEDALDLAQETFLRAWSALPNFRGGSSFSTWLYRLASNACVDLLRQFELTERHARALLRLDSPDAQRAALEEILKRGLNVAQTEAYIDHLVQRKAAPRRAAPVYRIRDVRLFLNTVKKSLAMMQSAGVDARCGKEETDREITLTIRIPK